MRIRVAALALTSMFAAACAVGGCNLLVGLDDVTITGAGATNGAGAANGGAASSHGGADSTSPGDAGGGMGGASTTAGGAGNGGSPSSSGVGASAGEGGGGSGGTSTTSGSGGTVFSEGGASGGGMPLQETVCGDAVDNDADGMMDSADADCALPAYAAPPCPVFRIYRSSGGPLGIPDAYAGHAKSTVVVADAFAVAHTAVLLNITHPRDADIEAILMPPFGSPRGLTGDNGGNNGANYTDTFLDQGCAPDVTAGSAPFQDCYAPEWPLPDSGEPAEGAWSLQIDDDMAGQTGTFDGWALVLCAQ